MARGDKRDPGLARQVKGLLRNLAGDEAIGAAGDRLLEVALCATGAPGDALERTLCIAHQLRHSAENALQLGGELTGRSASGAPQKSDFLFAKAAFDLPAQSLGQLSIVAQLGMRVERQVIGQQTDVMAQQCRQATLAKASDPAILGFPEPAVVHQYRIGGLRHGGIEQCLAGGDAADDALHLGAPFHLQAIWAIITKARGFKTFVEIIGKIVTSH